MEKWGEMAGVRASDTTLGLLDSEKSLNYTEPNPASPEREQISSSSSMAMRVYGLHGHGVLRMLRSLLLTVRIP